MSVETLTVIISTATMLLAFVGVIGWLVNRIDGLGERLTTRIDTVEDKLTARITDVERELVGVKVGLARLEGPPPRLRTTGR